MMRYVVGFLMQHERKLQHQIHGVEFSSKGYRLILQDPLVNIVTSLGSRIVLARADAIRYPEATNQTTADQMNGVERLYAAYEGFDTTLL